ncbi:MAG TPA: CRTAC1 family protein [Acidobacteriota bacterium]|nr:CRTAC1 family protein [Acidobacteriota bacterium]
MTLSAQRRLALIGLALALFSFSSIVHGQNFVKVTQEPFASDTGRTRGAAFVDYDGDGDDDLFISNSSINFLYRNNGDGSFTKVASSPLLNIGSTTTGISWADADNDGDLDLALAGTPSLLFRNDGGGGFTRMNLPVNSLNGWSCAWGDYDNDGLVDLVIARPFGFVPGAQSNTLLRNLGNLTFEAVTDSPVVTGLDTYTIPAWSDPDQDGDLDLFIGAGPAGTAALSPDYLYRNLLAETGSAEFERIEEGPLATDNRDGQLFNWIDYDNDRDLDAFVTNYGKGAGGLANNLYRNDGDHFTKITEGTIVTDEDVSLSSIAGDFDNDGDLDLVVPSDQLQPNRYYRNNGDGTFSRMDNAVTAEPMRLTWAGSASDYDEDGDLDLFIASGGDALFEPNALFRNDLDNGNHWTAMSLTGVVSNRAAIGAQVSVLATISGQPVWQLREVSSQNTFAGHNSLRVHFGLGDADQIDEIQIRWPSGILQVLRNVAVDQFLEIEESVVMDMDGDGLEDSVEDGAPNQGDGNADGVPDRDQAHVASLPAADGFSYVTLAAQPGGIFANVETGSRLPAAEDPPASLWFPIGLVSFDLLGLELDEGDQVVEMFVGEVPQLDTFYQYGPTPADNQPHWYPFLFSETTGAEIDGGGVTIHYQDGGRGDNDLEANGQISVTGAGPAVQLTPSYIPHLGDGTVLGIGFNTTLLLTNVGEDTLARIEFFETGGAGPLVVDLGDFGSGSSFDIPLAQGSTVVLETAAAGPLQVGFARIFGGPGVNGVAVFTRSELETEPSQQLPVTEAGFLVATPLQSFSLILDSIGVRDTGLAIVHPPLEDDSPGPSANVTLKLYSQSFELLGEHTLDPLPPGTHVARFISEFFQEQPEVAAMAAEMRGLVTVESDRPLVAVTLRQTDDPQLPFPMEVPILTGFPVIPGTPESPDP